MLTLHAFGKFSLLDHEGLDFSPVSQKARGLIVLVAAAPDLSRSRTWLQEKLWSDRSKDQASSSLRSCLTEIRKSLGPHVNLLRANRSGVCFDRAQFRVDYTRSKILGEASRDEPFEDLNIKDFEFQRLIRELRRTIIANHVSPSQSSTQQLSNRKQTIQLLVEDRGGQLAKIAGKCITQNISKALSYNGDFHTFTCDASRMSGLGEQPTSFTTLHLLIIEARGEVFISSSLRVPENGTEVWSTNTIVSGAPSEIANSLDIARLTLQSIDRICDVAVRHPDSEHSAFALEFHAKNLLFQLDRKSLIEADRLFALAFNIQPRGQYLAWRGLLRNIAFFQHRTTEFLEGETTAVDYSLEGLRHSPENATVQAISSQLDYIHQGDVQTSLVIAMQSVDLDNSNPMTWAFLSNALTANHRSKEAYETACKAVALSVGSKTQFFFEHFACMSAVANLEYQQAMQHAKTALHFRPEFVSTRRYEVALAMKLKDDAGLAYSVSTMQKTEADFTPSKMLDDNYPVITMRRLPLMDSVR